jgi:hypothetical protein
MSRAKTTQTDATQPHTTGTCIQTVVAVWAMGIATMVVGTALYGPPENSDRAFQLLHWWKRNPEPSPTTQRAKHG